MNRRCTSGSCSPCPPRTGVLFPAALPEKPENIWNTYTHTVLNNIPEEVQHGALFKAQNVQRWRGGGVVALYMKRKIFGTKFRKFSTSFKLRIILDVRLNYTTLTKNEVNFKNLIAFCLNFGEPFCRIRDR